MNPTPSTEEARRNEAVIAAQQGQAVPTYGAYVPPPQPPVNIADWATNSGGQGGNTPYLSEQDKLFNSTGYRDAAFSTVPTEEQAYSRQLALRQGEIDAANQTYNVLLKRTREDNLNRTGSAGARQARAGLLGSERGAAIDANTDVFNQDQVNSVEAQRQTAISSIMGYARADAAKMIADKQAAKKEGYDAYVAEIGRKEKKTNTAIANLAQSMVSQGTALDDRTASDLAKTYGVDKSVIISAYGMAKKESDKESLETQKTKSEIAKNQGMTLSKDQTYVQYNPKTGRYETMASGVQTPTTAGIGGTYAKGENPIVDAWAQRIFDGTAKITDIPAAQAGLRNAVTVALQASGNDLSGRPTVTEIGLKAKETATSLLDKFTKKLGTGAVGKSSAFNWATLPGTEKANFINDFNSLKAQLSLEGSKLLKGQGAVSDAERALLGQAVTKLNLGQSEPEFRSTLEGIINTLNGTPEHKGQDNAGGLTPEDNAKIGDMRSKGIPDEVIQQVVGKPLSLNNVGGDTDKASRIAIAIRNVESGGNYDAVGDAGTSKGAYQFQPASWSGWAKDYLGNANAPMTPENQDAVAIARIDDLLNQGYDARQIALIWNGGEPKVKKGFNKKIGLAYDSGAYAEKVLRELSKA